MIFTDFFKALGQLPDPRFRAVMVKGVGLTLLLLIGLVWGLSWLAGLLIPDSVTLPLLGPVGAFDEIGAIAAIGLGLVASVFLMVPVASIFTGFWLDDVMDAVEAEHLPHLRPAPRLNVAQTLVDSLGFLGVLVAGNLLALVLYLLFPPLAPVIFPALNGYLLGREYFQLIASRRMSPSEARALRRRHAGEIWLAGALMAAPLAIPIVNLTVPVLGAATFTHLFHRLAASSQTSRGRAR